jgi:hypothetical protein
MSIKDAYRPRVPITIKLYLFNYERKIISSCTKALLKGGGALQPKKHTFPKWVYQIYETWSTNMEPPKHNSLERQMRHNPPQIKKTYTTKRNR